MKRAAMLGLAVLICTTTVQGGMNLVRNPSSEADTRKPGVPDDWRASGGARHVEQTLTLDTGRDGTRCAKLACTRFEAVGPASHAMLSQYDLPVHPRGDSRFGVNHAYPRIRAPEYMEPLLETLLALMDKHGGCKPVWLTECGYYADDEPWIVPMLHGGFDRPLESERPGAQRRAVRASGGMKDER